MKKKSQTILLQKVKILDMNVNDSSQGTINPPIRQGTIRPSIQQSTFKRKLKSLTERILLIRIQLVYSINYMDGLDFTMLGSTNKIYNVKICRDSDSDLNYSCNCPDYTFRKSICKHIYWIGTKFFNTMDPQNWSLLNYNLVINKNRINKNTASHTGRNEDCPICLEKINYQNESTICCIYQCYNSVHTICWGRYNDISGSTKCIFCRGNSMPNF